VINRIITWRLGLRPALAGSLANEFGQDNPGKHFVSACSARMGRLVAAAVRENGDHPAGDLPLPRFLASVKVIEFQSFGVTGPLLIPFPARRRF
jgi:hypothetical protein